MRLLSDDQKQAFLVFAMHCFQHDTTRLCQELSHIAALVTSVSTAYLFGHCASANALSLTILCAISRNPLLVKSCSCIIWAIFTGDFFNALSFVSAGCLVALATKSHCHSKLVCRVVTAILMSVLCSDSVASSIVGAWAGWWRPSFPPDASSLTAQEIQCTECGLSLIHI